MGVGKQKTNYVKLDCFYAMYVMLLFFQTCTLHYFVAKAHSDYAANLLVIFDGWLHCKMSEKFLATDCPFHFALAAYSDIVCTGL